MTKTRMLALMAFNLMMVGCVSDQQLLADDQANAVNVATRRGQFELTCPTATGILLSSNLLQPVLWNGIERAEYTVGVEGCGQKSTYVVVCQVNSVSCFAVSGHNNAFSQ